MAVQKLQRSYEQVKKENILFIEGVITYTRKNSKKMFYRVANTYRNRFKPN